MTVDDFGFVDLRELLFSTAGPWTAATFDDCSGCGVFFFLGTGLDYLVVGDWQIFFSRTDGFPAVMR